MNSLDEYTIEMKKVLGKITTAKILIFSQNFGRYSLSKMWLLTELQLLRYLSVSRILDCSIMIGNLIKSFEETL